MVFPRPARKYADAWSQLVHFAPSAPISVSPATRPAVAAGAPLTTSSSVSDALGTPWMPMNSTRMTAAARKFMNGPAAIVTLRFQIAFL